MHLQRSISPEDAPLYLQSSGTFGSSAVRPGTRAWTVPDSRFGSPTVQPRHPARQQVLRDSWQMPPQRHGSPPLTSSSLFGYSTAASTTTRSSTFTTPPRQGNTQSVNSVNLSPHLGPTISYPGLWHSLPPTERRQMSPVASLRVTLSEPRRADRKSDAAAQRRAALIRSLVFAAQVSRWAS
jgi:hypothetical protein